MATILIIDDSMTARFKMNTLLSEKGHVIVEAINGIEALEKLIEESPDCIILDLLMPELDGFGVLEEMKKRKLTIPVIVLSADIQDTTRDKCLSYNIIEFLNKPLKNNGSLFEAIEKGLASK